MAVVELLGLPGSGKTTVVDAIASPRNIEVMSRYRSWSNVPAYSTSALRLAPGLARALLSNECSWRDCNKMIRLESSSSIVRRHARRGSRALLFDQGPLFLLLQLDGSQGSRSSAVRNGRAALLRRWGRTLDLVLVLDAPDDVLLDRIHRRGKRHALQGVDHDSARRSLDAQRETFERLLGELPSHGNVRTERIDTSSSSVSATTEAALTSVSSVASSR